MNVFQILPDVLFVETANDLEFVKGVLKDNNINNYNITLNSAINLKKLLEENCVKAEFVKQKFINMLDDLKGKIGRNDE